MFNKLWWLIRRPKVTLKLLSMGFNGYLNEIGWIKSFIHGAPVDSLKRPLPWVTYPFISFIDSRLDKYMSIFEYGSGNSTLWYSKRVNSVYSVEHDKLWYKKVRVRIPSNTKIYYEALGNNDKYADLPNSLNMKFDIIIIDGRDRVNCIKKSITSLKPNGVIVLDDSEREQYLDGIRFLNAQGFRQIDFWGISPGIFSNKCTTVFYKRSNCLGI